jgi:hypothetical protein
MIRKPLSTVLATNNSKFFMSGFLKANAALDWRETRQSVTLVHPSLGAFSNSNTEFSVTGECQKWDLGLTGTSLSSVVQVNNESQAVAGPLLKLTNGDLANAGPVPTAKPKRLQTQGRARAALSQASPDA